MAKAGVAKRSLAERLMDDDLIVEAIARGVQAALLRHKQAGNPIAVWRDEQVVWIEPEDIPVGAATRVDDGG